MRRLVLIGGGQAPTPVLRALSATSRRDVEIVLVTPSEQLLYSGMLPGWIAGHYTLPELTIDLKPLAQAAGAVLLPRRVVGLDLDRKAVLTDGGDTLEFDLLSIAPGATLDFEAIPGARDHALPIRPLENFVEGWQRIHAHALATTEPLRITVIGAGAGGVEIALAMKHRLRARHDQVRVQLVTGDGPILPGHGEHARTLMNAALLHQGVRLVEGMVRALERDAALLESDAALPSDVALLITGPVAKSSFIRPPFILTRSLPSL